MKPQQNGRNPFALPVNATNWDAAGTRQKGFMPARANELKKELEGPPDGDPWKSLAGRAGRENEPSTCAPAFREHIWARFTWTTPEYFRGRRHSEKIERALPTINDAR